MTSSTSTKGVALVTGSSQGIGLAIAQRLAKDGFDIGLNDIPSKLNQLKEAQSKIAQETGRKVEIFPGDISQEQDVKAMIDGIVKALGGLDVMVANAGICMAGPMLDTIVSVAEWDRIFAINVRGTFLCYQYAAKQMIAQGRGGRILGACSGSGKQGQLNMSAYGSTKFALRGLTQATALELGKHGITCNMYAPGPIDTEMSRAAAAGIGNAEAVMAMYTERLALKRFGVTEDVSNVVSFLASKESQFITGQSINVDGGMLFD
ncbi:short chain oxidoreductase [Dendrothele bispora CBS 962.96]|uniref:Short chain oxidoreductase n=1 Tax=Dendrothele bispora (strain CBS 962.96) TaxID=1314807 RepID=A0A4S8MIQ2_DENBC|nr:short chain oxidoreductase [Dendrothele bispora CBS 962.96]